MKANSNSIDISKLNKVKVLKGYFGSLSMSELKDFLKSDKDGYNELVLLAAAELKEAGTFTDEMLVTKK